MMHIELSPYAQPNMKTRSLLISVTNTVISFQCEDIPLTGPACHLKVMYFLCYQLEIKIKSQIFRLFQCLFSWNACH